jgi:hypothetical protein
MFEEHSCSPIVATFIRNSKQKTEADVIPKVLGECACSARSYRSWVFLHRRVEGIATDDLVNVSGRKFAWLNERIKTLNAQRRTSEA